MSESTKATLSRRKLLGRAATTGLLVTPAAGFLASCATDDGGDADPTTEPKPNESEDPADAGADNPFGYDGTTNVDTVFFTGGFGEDYPNEFKRIFEDRYPGATVGVLGTETIGTVVQPRLAGGNPPDVFNNSGAEDIDLSGLVNDGAVIDLTPLLDAPSIDDPNVLVRDTLQPGTVAAGEFGDGVYALNYAYSTYGMWYNAALFREHGWEAPNTWSDFLALSAEMQTAGIAPFIHTGVHPWYIHNLFMEWVYRAGGLDTMLKIDNLEADAWKQDAVVAAAERIQEMVDSGLIYPGAEGLDHTQSQQAWLDGEAGLIWNGSWLENEMRETTPEGFEMTFAAPFSPTDDPATAFGTMRVGAGEQFVIPTGAANEAGGLELLRVMLSQEAGNAFSQLTSSMTVVKGSAEGVDSSALASASGAAAAAPEVMDWKALGWYGTIYEALEPAILELVAGRSNPGAFLDAVQAEADRVAADDTIEKFTREA